MLRLQACMILQLKVIFVIKKMSEIKMLFKKKEIYKYNITCQNQKSLFFNFRDNNIFKEIKDLSRFLISFEKDNKVSEFSISSNCDVNKINKIIDLCLKNMSSGKLKNIDESNKSTDCKEIYNELDKKNYINWLQNELDLLLKNLYFNFNFVYTIDALKSVTISLEKSNELYECSSTCGIMNIDKFENNVFLNNYFINSDLSTFIIKKFESQ